MRRNKPGDRFTRRMIARLLSWPKPLEITGHPLQTIWQELRAALPDYDVVDGEKVDDVEEAKAYGADGHTKAYHINEQQVLRTQTTGDFMTSTAWPRASGPRAFGGTRVSSGPPGPTPHEGLSST
jgi:hypothetical protein